MQHSVMTSRRAWLLLAALIASALAWFGMLVVEQPRPASAAPGECPPGYGPIGPATDPDFFDQNVAVFAGGNFAVGEAAAESEGVLVALGDASFQRTSRRHLQRGRRRPGIGRLTQPRYRHARRRRHHVGQPSDDCEVGFGIGGDVVVGGVRSPLAPWSRRAGRRQGRSRRTWVAAATAPYADIPAQIQSKSAEIAALPATGTVVTTGFSHEVHRRRNLEPAGVHDPGCPCASGPARLRSSDIPDGAAVYINVTASAAETSNIKRCWTRRGGVPTNSPEFPTIATHTLWNFPAATSVTLRRRAPSSPARSSSPTPPAPWSTRCRARTAASTSTETCCTSVQAPRCTTTRSCPTRTSTAWRSSAGSLWPRRWSVIRGGSTRAPCSPAPTPVILDGTVDPGGQHLVDDCRRLGSQRGGGRVAGGCGVHPGRDPADSAPAGSCVATRGVHAGLGDDRR